MRSVGFVLDGSVLGLWGTSGPRGRSNEQLQLTAAARAGPAVRRIWKRRRVGGDFYSVDAERAGTRLRARRAVARENRTHGPIRRPAGGGLGRGRHRVVSA